MCLSIYPSQIWIYDITMASALAPNVSTLKELLVLLMISVVHYSQHKKLGRYITCYTN